MSIPILSRSIWALGLVASLSAAACGGPSSDPKSQAEANQKALASADARLKGTWRLTDYRPDIPLEPMLAGLLALQMQTMNIKFENGRMHAVSPSLQIDVPYRLTEAGGPLFKMVATKDGVGYASACQFSMNDDKIAFRADTAPWRGTGTLARVSR